MLTNVQKVLRDRNALRAEPELRTTDCSARTVALATSMYLCLAHGCSCQLLCSRMRMRASAWGRRSQTLEVLLLLLRVINGDPAAGVRKREEVLDVIEGAHAGLDKESGERVSLIGLHVVLGNLPRFELLAQSDALLLLAE